MKKILIILSITFILFANVKSETIKRNIEINILPVKKVKINGVLKHPRIADVSAKDKSPLHNLIPYPNGYYFISSDITKEEKVWLEKYTFPLSFTIEVKNVSSKNIKLYEEWCSWGYCNLKIVFSNWHHEYVITKKEGIWYRNFPAWHELKPGESFKIPVALSNHIWNGVNSVFKNSNSITSVRALYEQYDEYNKNFWNGSVSSKQYSAKELLLTLNFLSKEKSNNTSHESLLDELL